MVMVMIIIIPILVFVAMFGLVLALLEDSGKGTDQQDKRIDEIRVVEGPDGQIIEKQSVIQSTKKTIENFKDKQKKKQLKNSRKRNNSNKNSTVQNMLTMTQVKMTSEQFALVKLLLGMVFAFIAIFVCRKYRVSTTNMLMIVAVAGIIGFILPAEWLKHRAKKFQESIRLELPDVIDLLVVSVEAGLGFDNALMRLYEKNKSVLMEELMQAIRDIQRGVSRKEAYVTLSKRFNVKEFTTFLTAMILADQLGTPIKSVLKAQAEALRIERGRRAEKKAKEAPVKMLIPMVIFIFPVIFIVLLGPAALTIMDIFG